MKWSDDKKEFYLQLVHLVLGSNRRLSKALIQQGNFLFAPATVKN